jgi:hypothetical protein
MSTVTGHSHDWLAIDRDIGSQRGLKAPPDLDNAIFPDPLTSFVSFATTRSTGLGKSSHQRHRGVLVGCQQAHDAHGPQRGPYALRWRLGQSRQGNHAPLQGRTKHRRRGCRRQNTQQCGQTPPLGSSRLPVRRHRAVHRVRGIAVAAVDSRPVRCLSRLFTIHGEHHGHNSP